MVLPARHHCHSHTVAIKGEHRVTLRDEDGLAAIIRLEGVLTVRLTDKGTLLHLRLQVQAIRVIGSLGEIVVPCHLVHRVNGKHLGWMCVEFQGTEYLLKGINLIRMFLEEGLQHLYDLLFRQSFTTFLFTHSISFLVSMWQRYKILENILYLCSQIYINYEDTHHRSQWLYRVFHRGRSD